MKKEKKKEGKRNSLFAARVLGNSLGPLRHGVFGQFSRKKQTNSSLDFSAGDRVLLVVVSQTGGLGRHTLKDVVDERVHDAHGLAGDPSLGMDLLEHFVNVDGVALLARLSLLLLIASRGLGLGGGLLLAFLACNFARHDYRRTCAMDDQLTSPAELLCKTLRITSEGSIFR